MINVKVLKVEERSNNVRRVTFSYEDHRFPGKTHESYCDVNTRNQLMTYYDFGVAYTMSKEESSTIRAALVQFDN